MIFDLLSAHLQELCTVDLPAEVAHSLRQPQLSIPTAIAHDYARGAQALRDARAGRENRRP